MTPEQMRVAIAEACGWTQIKNANTMAACGIWVGYPPRMQIVGKPESLPRFLESLDAMHEAEKVLTPQQGYDFPDHLAQVVLGYGCEKDGTICLNIWANKRLVSATAAQRAEAFLRTIGK